jgi:hypothetical protein
MSSDQKPFAIGLVLVALLLLGIMYWKYMMPHPQVVQPGQLYIPGPADYGARSAPPGGQNAPPGQPAPGPH